MTASGVSSNAEPASTAAPARARQRAATIRLKLFCGFIVLAPCLLLLLAVPIARTDWLVRRTVDLYFSNLGYGLTLRNANCDVVIYGDSSALTGVNPSVIQKITGLRACNIAEYEGVFRTDRLLIPDEFVRHNRAPRFMVMAFCPWNLAPYQDWAKNTTFEAILMRVRYAPNLQTFVDLAMHPSQTFDFLTRTIRMSVASPMQPELPQEKLHYRADHLGFMPMTGEELSDCSTYPDRIREPDLRWIGSMRQRYADHGTRVLVDVTPLPACADAFGYYAQRLRGQTDNQLERWPMRLFNGTAHMLAPGSNAFSESIARQLRAALQAGRRR